MFIKLKDTPECWRLRFVWDFCDLMQASREQMAAALEFTTADSISAAVNRGDLRLSQIEDIIKAVGGGRYELQIRLADREGQSLEVSGRFRRIGQYGQTNRLDFLWQYLAMKRISKRDLADALGLTPWTVTSWYASNDIMWSRIHQVAAALGCDIEVDIHPKEEEDAVNGGEARTAPCQHYSITVEQCSALAPPVGPKTKKKKTAK